MSLIFILVCFGLAGGIVGRKKGSSFFLWFAVSFFIPFGGLLAALLFRWDKDELRRQCPECGKVVKLHDALCVRCGTDLEWPEQAIAAESATPRAPQAAAG